MALIGWEIILGGIGTIATITGVVYAIWKDRKNKKKNENHKQKMVQSAKQETHTPQSNTVNNKIPKVITLLDERISIPKNSNVKRQFDLRCGDRVKGHAEETWGRRFSLYVMNEENYHNYQNGEDYQCEREYEDTVQTHIFVDIPYDDIWYIVFDTTYKQVDRRVNVKLQKKSK